MVTNDFGFSLVSEEELRKHEEELKNKLEEQSQLTRKVHKNAAVLNDKLNGLRNMIMPLLNNLASSADRQYIYWPDRVAKIQEFIDKVNKYVDSDVE